MIEERWTVVVMMVVTMKMKIVVMVITGDDLRMKSRAMPQATRTHDAIIQKVSSSPSSSSAFTL